MNHSGNKVFISYSTQDKNFADAACTFLEKEGLRCWIAPRDILPGEDYGEAIIDAIQSCKVMVVIFTMNANRSRFVNKEVERAVSKGSVVIPVRFQDIMPTKSLEFFLSSDHWLDAITPPIETHLEKLTTTVKVLFSNSANIIAIPEKLRSEKDIEDIKMFNEISPDDWYGPPTNFLSRWVKNIFSDKN